MKMKPNEQAINIIERFFKEANLDGNKSIACARLFTKMMKSFWGENTYCFVENEKRIGIKVSAYWDRVRHFIDEIEKKAIIERTEKLCNNKEAQELIKKANKKK